MSQMSQLDLKCKERVMDFIMRGKASPAAIHTFLCDFAKEFKVTFAQASRYLDDVIYEELT